MLCFECKVLVRLTLATVGQEDTWNQKCKRELSVVRPLQEGSPVFRGAKGCPKAECFPVGLNLRKACVHILLKWGTGWVGCPYSFKFNPRKAVRLNSVLKPLLLLRDWWTVVASSSLPTDPGEWLPPSPVVQAAWLVFLLIKLCQMEVCSVSPWGLLPRGCVDLPPSGDLIFLEPHIHLSRKVRKLPSDFRGPLTASAFRWVLGSVTCIGKAQWEFQWSSQLWGLFWKYGVCSLTQR